MRKKIKSLLMSTILLGSLAAGNNPVFASAHDDESWNVAAYNPGNVKSSAVVAMYNTDERLEWSVSGITPGNFSYVTLSGVNCTVKIFGNKSANMSAKGTKYFYINNVKTTSSNRYANLKISLTYEDYVTYYGGRVRIVK